MGAYKSIAIIALKNYISIRKLNLRLMNILRHRPGFTLIELLIAVAIVGILAAVALPSYQEQVRKSRRADAVSMVAAVQQAQERWRANNASYGSLADVTRATSAVPPGLGLNATSANGYYTLDIAGAAPAGYTITATAVAGTSQALDTGCATLNVVVTNGSPTYTQNQCWSK